MISRRSLLHPLLVMSPSQQQQAINEEGLNVDATKIPATPRASTRRRISRTPYQYPNPELDSQQQQQQPQPVLQKLRLDGVRPATASVTIRNGNGVVLDGSYTDRKQAGASRAEIGFFNNKISLFSKSAAGIFPSIGSTEGNNLIYCTGLPAFPHDSDVRIMFSSFALEGKSVIVPAAPSQPNPKGRSPYVNSASFWTPPWQEEESVKVSVIVNEKKMDQQYLFNFVHIPKIKKVVPVAFQIGVDDKISFHLTSALSSQAYCQPVLRLMMDIKRNQNPVTIAEVAGKLNPNGKTVEFTMFDGSMDASINGKIILEVEICEGIPLLHKSFHNSMIKMAFFNAPRRLSFNPAFGTVGKSIRISIKSSNIINTGCILMELYSDDNDHVHRMTGVTMENESTDKCEIVGWTPEILESGRKKLRISFNNGRSWQPAIGEIQFVDSPVLNTLLPTSGCARGGTRVCLLGRGFTGNSPILVRISPLSGQNETIIPAKCDSENCIIFHTLSMANPGEARVCVSVDGGESFSDPLPTKFWFYLPFTVTGDVFPKVINIEGGNELKLQIRDGRNAFSRGSLAIRFQFRSDPTNSTIFDVPAIFHNTSPRIGLVSCIVPPLPKGGAATLYVSCNGVEWIGNAYIAITTKLSSPTKSNSNPSTASSEATTITPLSPFSSIMPRKPYSNALMIYPSHRKLKNPNASNEVVSPAKESIPVVVTVPIEPDYRITRIHPAYVAANGGTKLTIHVRGEINEKYCIAFVRLRIARKDSTIPPPSDEDELLRVNATYNPKESSFLAMLPPIPKPPEPGSKVILGLKLNNHPIFVEPQQSCPGAVLRIARSHWYDQYPSPALSLAEQQLQTRNNGRAYSTSNRTKHNNNNNADDNDDEDPPHWTETELWQWLGTTNSSTPPEEISFPYQVFCSLKSVYSTLPCTCSIQILVDMGLKTLISDDVLSQWNVVKTLAHNLGKGKPGGTKFLRIPRDDIRRLGILDPEDIATRLQA